GEAACGDLDCLALGGGEGCDAEQAADDDAVARGHAAGRSVDGDDVAILDEGLHGSDSFRGCDADDGNATAVGSRDLAVEVGERCRHLAVCGVGDALAVVFDGAYAPITRSEEHTSELQSRENLVCRLLLEKRKT